MLRFDINKATPLSSMFSTKSSLARVLFTAWLTTILTLSLVFVGLYSYFKFNDFNEASLALSKAHLRSYHKILESNVESTIRLLDGICAIGDISGIDDADDKAEHVVSLYRDLEVPAPPEGSLYILSREGKILLTPWGIPSTKCIFLDESGNDITGRAIAAAGSSGGNHLEYYDSGPDSPRREIIYCFMRTSPTLGLTVCSDIRKGLLDSAVALNLERLKISLFLELVFSGVVFLVIILLTVYYIVRLSRSIKYELGVIIDFLEHNQKKEVLAAFSAEDLQYREFSIIGDSARVLAEKIKRLFDWLGRKALEAETANQQKASLLSLLNSELSQGLASLEEACSGLESANAESVGKAVAGITTMLRNIETTLHFGDTTSSAMKEDTDAAGVVREAFGFVQKKAEEKGIKFSLDVVGKLPKSVKTDPLLLKQLLTNIYDCSLACSQKGAVECTVRVPDEGGKIVFCAVNKSVFLSEDDLDDIRSYPRPRQDHAMLSLKVAVCSFLAEKLGGNFVLLSTESTGTLFSLEIPA